MSAVLPPVTEFARLLGAHRGAVVFTGAGMSTESGLPDFRSTNLGTLRGFPNPPAMVRGEQSSPAPHAIVPALRVGRGMGRRHRRHARARPQLLHARHDDPVAGLDPADDRILLLLDRPQLHRALLGREP